MPRADPGDGTVSGATRAAPVPSRILRWHGERRLETGRAEQGREGRASVRPAAALWAFYQRRATHLRRLRRIRAPAAGLGHLPDDVWGGLAGTGTRSARLPWRIQTTSPCTTRAF